MKDIVVNLSHSRKFFIYTLKADAKRFKTRYGMKYHNVILMIHQTLRKIKSTKNNYHYRLTFSDCVILMMSVADFNDACHSNLIKDGHIIRNTKQKTEVKMEYQCNIALIKFWKVLRKTGYFNKNFAQLMKRIKKHNQHLKNLLS